MSEKLLLAVSAASLFSGLVSLSCCAYQAWKSRKEFDKKFAEALPSRHLACRGTTVWIDGLPLDGLKDIWIESDQAGAGLPPSTYEFEAGYPPAVFSPRIFPESADAAFEGPDDAA